MNCIRQAPSISRPVHLFTYLLLSPPIHHVHYAVLNDRHGSLTPVTHHRKISCINVITITPN